MIAEQRFIPGSRVRTLATLRSHPRISDHFAICQGDPKMEPAGTSARVRVCTHTGRALLEYPGPRYGWTDCDLLESEASK